MYKEDLKLHDSWKTSELVNPYHEPSLDKGIELGAKTAQKRLYDTYCNIYKEVITEYPDINRNEAKTIAMVDAFEDFMNGKISMRKNE